MTVTPDWSPAASPELLAKRGAWLAAIRAFMAGRGILEVDTPALARSGATDPNIHSLQTTVQGPDGPVTAYLHTSPEFPMKRLLAAGSGPIYEIAKVFRDGESGRRHQPEFLMLEWYRPGLDHQALMDETGALLNHLGLPDSGRIPYGDVFAAATGLDPHGADTSLIKEKARELGLHEPGDERPLLLEFLFATAVAPDLGHDRPQFVYDYPACEAALARIRPDPVPVAERFELFLNGMEIANGFHELADAAEQRRRFEDDNRRRRTAGLPEVRIDQKLLAALEAGLPDCAGVALGLDRLFMVLAGADDIAEVLAFPHFRR